MFWTGVASGVEEEMLAYIGGAGGSPLPPCPAAPQARSVTVVCRTLVISPHASTLTPLSDFRSFPIPPHF